MSSNNSLHLSSSSPQLSLHHSKHHRLHLPIVLHPAYVSKQVWLRTQLLVICLIFMYLLYRNSIAMCRGLSRETLFCQCNFLYVRVWLTSCRSISYWFIVYCMFSSLHIVLKSQCLFCFQTLEKLSSSH